MRKRASGHHSVLNEARKIVAHSHHLLRKTNYHVRRCVKDEDMQSADFDWKLGMDSLLSEGGIAEGEGEEEETEGEGEKKMQKQPNMRVQSHDISAEQGM